MLPSSVEMKFMICINHTFPDIPSPDEQQRANGKISPIIYDKT